jgi:hypothetical protein
VLDSPDPKSDSAAPARFISAFWNGRPPVYSRQSGKRGLPNMTRWRASRGDGKVSMGPCSKRLWRKRQWDATQLIGGKKGSKRHLLVDGRGVPLSVVVTGANEHDVTQLDQVPQAIMVKRKTPSQRRSKHLCADAGYRGKRALETHRIARLHSPCCWSTHASRCQETRPDQEGATLGGRGLP